MGRQSQNPKNRVQWREPRADEVFEMLADQNSDGTWDFWERSIWELRWYPVSATPAGVRKADELLARRSKENT